MSGQQVPREEDGWHLTILKSPKAPLVLARHLPSRKNFVAKLGITDNSYDNMTHLFVHFPDNQCPAGEYTLLLQNDVPFNVVLEP